MRVANAPCSWGALEFDWAGPAPAFARVLDEMAATGYAGTELGDWGFLPTDPTALGNELAARQLDLLGAFVPVKLSDAAAHDRGIEAALRVARLLQSVAGTAPFVVLSDDTAANQWRTARVGRITPADGLDDNEWNTLADGATTIATAVKKETGLRTVFHHHCATFVETPAEIDQLMSRTDSAATRPLPRHRPRDVRRRRPARHPRQMAESNLARPPQGLRARHSFARRRREVGLRHSRYATACSVSSAKATVDFTGDRQPSAAQRLRRLAGRRAGRAAVDGHAWRECGPESRVPADFGSLAPLRRAPSSRAPSSRPSYCFPVRPHSSILRSGAAATSARSFAMPLSS